ncbi:pyridoxine/pyridoxamine 5'-phosphate oxidase [Streptomyces silvisoli]|uniref:Pyridoxamine 5'-phosphate oxidase family protein n=1 Tax=Streptomyces silvisoli TaxID=3034235 RepID=A0ABT5ZPF2_9ACTN|nr:pyridoxamine 5'-phosphate oxidase family protein [Streptomyces silvisoli]MDF3291705.1 pyridoxamine 5'-phosphate oxidase family protein [Streptomyces silvisoli]
MEYEALRERLRRTPALAAPLPAFDPRQAPPEPGPLFADWLTDALDDAVPEPHVMTLSTADAAGRPSSRVLMLRGFELDAGALGFVFASEAASRKGRELTANPHAALNWYWPRHGRQIRATGPVTALDRQAACEDFLGRSEPSRAAGFTGLMSAELPDTDAYSAYQRARAHAREIVSADPRAVPDGHTVYVLRADEAEFFQGDSGPDRFHRRLRYVREGERWTRRMLWP